MCGLAGIFSREATIENPLYRNAVKAMTALQIRRGPDDEGFWNDPSGKINMGFRRLAVMDISSAGHQPMISGDGRSALVFNGEIYNYLELKKELHSHGIRFKSNTDSEVLLESLNLWGTSAISKLNGMFAFAWYFLPENKLILARDHAGIKPLYYYLPEGNQGIAFSSQYNALLHTPWKSPGNLRNDTLKLFLHLHHIPAPYGILENTFQLEPGHFLEVFDDGKINKQQWWHIPESPEINLYGTKALDSLESALSQAVANQKMADVPLGVFLSGGVDSPLITALANSNSIFPLHSFTIGNQGWGQDESELAKEFSHTLNVNHHLKNINENEAVKFVDQAFLAQHEPFGDFSILPALCLSEFARRNITVSLSGDGGDELFFGYERPVSLLRNGEDFQWPHTIRKILYGCGKYGFGKKRSTVITSESPGHYYFEVNGRIRSKKIKELAPALHNIPNDFNLYNFGKYQNKIQLAHYSRKVEYYGQLQRCLKKLDMASMHHSLEVRVPFLDKQVVELSLQIDPFENMVNGHRKKLLKSLLSKYIHPNSFQKKKLGFSIPLGEWLRGPLRVFVEDHLFNSKLYPEDTFNMPNLRNYWKEHLNRTHDHKWGIWTILSLQGWKKTHLIEQAH